MTMRIGLSGPGGTGKTTLARQLARDLQIRLIDEGVRRFLVTHEIDSPWLTTWREQIELQRHYLASKIRQESVHDAFVSDRTALDMVALLRVRGELSGHSAPEPLVQRALAHANGSYDLILNFAPRRPHRLGTDPTWAQAEHEAIDALCRDLGLRTLIVPPLPFGDLRAFVLAGLTQ